MIVVLVVEQVDDTWGARPSLELVLREVLDVVVPDRVDVFRPVWVEPLWFAHCSATMLNNGILDDRMPRSLNRPSLARYPVGHSSLICSSQLEL